ncbi:hypothetical protein [Moraxella bovis]|uniref:hypothetical protein n=1 Tax=Moraxella bovis TaxID=476 RepID=UPI0022271899|nr:hypothetical protein [Moraxella bovis]UZA19170.1 hypothetical protein LP088_12880 [Moraxella bovis]
MTQTIKPNDLVYIPTHSLKVLTAKLDAYPTLYATDGSNVLVHFYPTGLGFTFEDDSNPERPIVWLATPENKAKIEAFYGCQLEDIPVDEELEDFINGLNELSNFYSELKLSDGNFKASVKMEKLKSIKSNLIQMFKERGNAHN